MQIEEDNTCYEKVISNHRLRQKNDTGEGFEDFCAEHRLGKNDIGPNK